jgi:hypothetical protein
MNILKKANRGVGVAIFLLCIYFWGQYDLYTIILIRSIDLGGIDLAGTVFWQELTMNWWKVAGMIITLVVVYFFKIDEPAN